MHNLISRNQLADWNYLESSQETTQTQQTITLTA